MRPPNIIRRAAHASKAVGRVVQAIAQGEDVLVTDEQHKARLKVCGGCLLRHNKVCGYCGCNIEHKAKLATEECDGGYWP